MSIISIIARLSLISCASLVSLARAEIHQYDIYHQRGCELEIIMPSNQTTSYTWIPYQYNQAAVLGMVDHYEKTDDVTIGGGGYQHWKFSFAENVNETTISFIYMPRHLFSPQQDTSSYDQAIYHIHISDSSQR